MNNFDYDYNYDLPEDEYHGGNLVCEVLESHFYFYGSWWMIPILQVGKSKQQFHIYKSIKYEEKYLRFWAFGSDSKIRYFSDLQGKNGDRDPERLSKNPQKMDFTFCDRVFRSNK